MNLTAVGVVWLMFSLPQNLAELAYEKSRTELATGNFADAEISVREAISRSLYFSPKSELGKSRGKGLLEMSKNLAKACPQIASGIHQ